MAFDRWLYDHTPVWWQNVMCTMAGYVREKQRYDRRFEERRALFRESRRWSRSHAERYQLDRLQEMLCRAYEKVPYYRCAMQSAKVLPADIRSLEDMSKLPPLSKDDVRRAGRSLIASDYERQKLVVSHSGGSTGMPLTCYHDLDSLRACYAAFWEYYRPGVRRGDPYATFQGVRIVPPRQRGGPYWRMNRASNQRLYSIFHMSEHTIEEYLADLDRFGAVYFQGYSNSLYLLARLLEECGLHPTTMPKAVFTSSETLLASYRATIERVFRTKVWDAYSQDETCGSITEYECGHYHYDRAYGYMEFHDLEVRGNRKVAEIFCTGFLNRAWPLIRYRVGDVVEYEEAERCPGCGRPGPIIHEIRGRTGDVLVTPSGLRFPHISLIVKDLRGVRQVQLVQESLDAVTIRFVPSDDFQGQIDTDLMVQCFDEAVNEPIRWSLERVAEIPRTQLGKFRSIISRLPAS